MRLRYHGGARELARRRGAFRRAAAAPTLISNTLVARIETWSDPGDYPSGAAAGPRDSHEVLASIDGCVVFEFDRRTIGELGDDLAAWRECLLALFKEHKVAVAACPWRVRIRKIDFRNCGNCRICCWVEDFDYWGNGRA